MLCRISVRPDFIRVVRPETERPLTMTLDRAVFAFAGLMIMLSVALVYFVSMWWLLFTLFIGINMLQSAFTGFCPAAKMFHKLGVKPGAAYK